MTAIEVIVPHPGPRLWHRIVIERLRTDGHGVSVVHQSGAGQWPPSMKAALRFERRLFRRHEPGLASILPEISEMSSATAPNLRVDLSGAAPNGSIPTLRLAFDGACSDAAMVVAIANGRLPEIEAVLDADRVVGRAFPMLDKRESTALGSDDVLARAVTLVLAMVKRFDGGWSADAGKARPRILGAAGDLRFMSAYACKALPRLGREALRRSRYRHAHWRVGYRFIDGPGIAQTGALGTGWARIADRGDRFYADPFAFEWQGKPYIFVEDYPHATKKAVISVAEFDAGGVAQTPDPVLEEPFHLSYPQVFHWEGEVWMLPEGSAGGGLTLYRAAEFPRRWEAHSTLLEGEISDATLLEHQGRWWLFATQRDGHGSTSDTLVVFQAPKPVGPWTPHRLNPILIDRRTARPGGAFIRTDGKLLLPVQDGTLGYGGGLGLVELLELNDENVRLSAPAAISETGDWPYPQIHTLNRAGRLEVIDGIAAVRK
ncbi:glucosamine inositolphosphorylceramide transferase family protein [Mesorhizobium sp. A623]